MPFLSEDYLFRVINQVLRALAAVAGLKLAKRYREAEQIINESLGELFGLRANLLKQLDDDRLLEMLTLQDNLDLQRVGLAAELFKEEGEVLLAQGEAAGSQASFLRALNFFLEAALDGPAEVDTELPSKVESLMGALAGAPLPEATRYSLFSYYEKIGRFRQAEAALAGLEASAPGNDETVGEFYDFYQRLLEKTDPELAAGGLERAEILAKLDEFEIEE